MYEKKQSALFPDFPGGGPAIDTKTGEFTPQWLLFFQQLSQALQFNFQKEGVKAPSQTSANIANITNTDTIIGNIIYDTDLNEWIGVKVTTPSTPGVAPVTSQVTFTVT